MNEDKKINETAATPSLRFSLSESNGTTTCCYITIFNTGAMNM